MPHTNYTLVHKPQHRPNRIDHNRKCCTFCPGGQKAPTLWEQYETICSNPFALEILTSKTSLSRQAVVNSMILFSKKTPAARMTEESNERVARGKKMRGRKKGWGRDFGEEMDVEQARLINWENEQNFERHDVVFEENRLTEDEVEHGEYLKTLFPGFRGRGLAEEVVAVGDQELRDMGILYDSSEDENDRSRGPSTPVSVPLTPHMTATAMPFLSDADLDELWEMVEGRRLPVEMRGEWDIVSEF